MIRLKNNYSEEERLYSTGNEELDELLEKAFCDGYEYAQREFSSITEELKKRAILAGTKVKSGVSNIIKTAKDNASYKSQDQRVPGWYGYVRN